MHDFGELKQKKSDTPAEELESTEVKLWNPERVSFWKHIKFKKKRKRLSRSSESY